MLLRRRWRWTVLLVVAAVTLGGGALTQLVAEDWPASILIGVVAGASTMLAYAGGPLRAAVIARWASRRAIAELDLMLPLVSRALPLLLLFFTFLFINTEVWQVTAALRSTDLVAAVLMFSAIAVAFLLNRLPQEVRDVQETAAGEGIARACRGTPLEQRAIAMAEARRSSPLPAAPQDPLTATQRANLMIVLLLMQAMQVLLLGLAVFLFFVVFGLLAIRTSVIQDWIGHPPSLIRVASLSLPISWELLRVSVFLSAFSGLYFTVYAVTDAGYRSQFLGELSRGLEQAVGVREVYRALLRQSPQRPLPPSS